MAVGGHDAACADEWIISQLGRHATESPFNLLDRQWHPDHAGRADENLIRCGATLGGGRRRHPPGIRQASRSGRDITDLAVDDDRLESAGLDCLAAEYDRRAWELIAREDRGGCCLTIADKESQILIGWLEATIPAGAAISLRESRLLVEVHCVTQDTGIESRIAEITAPSDEAA